MHIYCRITLLHSFLSIIIVNLVWNQINVFFNSYINKDESFKGVVKKKNKIKQKILDLKDL